MIKIKETLSILKELIEYFYPILFNNSIGIIILMDVLKPELIWVNGRCYRFFESDAWTNKDIVDSYVEDDFEADYTDEETSDINIEVAGSKLKHSFHVPKPFFPFIIGSKNAVRKRIETDTKTSIYVPKQDGDIVITGSDRRGILSARQRINLIIEVSRKRLSYTHFLSIPLNEDVIMTNFISFKHDVIKKFGNVARGVDELLFPTPHKLHVTLLMFTLLDEEERKRAVKALMDCKQHIIDPFIKEHGLITITLKGIECMNDDPANVNVLFAEVKTENNVLQTLAEAIVDYFAKMGLKANANRNVKLHVTFMNTRYKLKENQAYQDHIKTFDATQLLNEYKDTCFGSVVLKEIHLSQLQTATDTDYYQATAKIKLDEK